MRDEPRRRLRGRSCLVATLAFVAGFLDAATGPPAGIILVYRDGGSEEVAGYEVDGDQVRVYAAGGGERLVAKARVDLERSAEETTARLRQLYRDDEASKRRELAALVAARRAARAGEAGEANRELLFFTASWCRWCRKQRAAMTASDAVVAALAQFRFREVDYDDERELAASLGVGRLPAVVVVAPTARVHQGFLAEADLLAWLRD